MTMHTTPPSGLGISLQFNVLIQIGWDALSDEGGSTLLGYGFRVRQAGADWPAWSDSLTGTLYSVAAATFTAGVVYEFQARGVYDDGAGPGSETFLFNSLGEEVEDVPPEQVPRTLIVPLHNVLGDAPAVAGALSVRVRRDDHQTHLPLHGPRGILLGASETEPILPSPHMRVPNAYTLPAARWFRSLQGTGWGLTATPLPGAVAQDIPEIWDDPDNPGTVVRIELIHSTFRTEFTAGDLGVEWSGTVGLADDWLSLYTLRLTVGETVVDLRRGATAEGVADDGLLHFYRPADDDEKGALLSLALALATDNTAVTGTLELTTTDISEGTWTFRLMPTLYYRERTHYVLTVGWREYVFRMPAHDASMIELLDEEL